MTPTVKAVFFDIDDTVYSTTQFAEIARDAAAQAMIGAGLRMDKGAVLRELAEVIDEFSSNYERHFDKLLLRFPRASYEPVDPVIIVAAGVVAYHDTKFRELSPYEDAMEVLRRLSSRKLKLGIITGGLAVKQAEKLIRLGILKHVTPGAIFISEQVGIAKKNPKLYQRAAESLGCEPGECMHVGDSPVNDIDPANAAGMITVLNRRSGKYLDQAGRTEPDHVIHNFWDLLEILEREYGLAPEGGA